MKKIYLAAGCFWAAEKLYSLIPGVISSVSGYVNGDDNIIPDYSSVCTGRTGYKEAVMIEYDENAVDLDLLLFVYFQVIDPTVRDRQGMDRGHQYQTGIYWFHPEDESAVMRIAEIEKTFFSPFEVELEPYRNFYPAEEYHQKYLEKNPGGYCHISPVRMMLLMEYLEKSDWKINYDRPARSVHRIRV